MLKKLLIAALALLLGPISTFAQSETVIVPGGAIYDVSTGAFLGFTNRNNGKEERLTATLGSGLTATSVVCLDSAKAFTSTCSSATPSFSTVGATGAITQGSGNTTVTLQAGLAAPSIIIVGTDQAGTRIKISDFTSTTAWAMVQGHNGVDNAGFTIYDYTANANRMDIAETTGSTSFSGGINSTTIGSGTPAAGAFTTLTSSSAPVLTGSSTNDAASAGKIGELLTVTVASGSAVSLTTATSANIATLSVTAGDWDCSAQVTHNAAATTSVTLLQIGISATTATLPTQAGGSGIGTDPLAIFRQAAAVPGGALTTNVGPVRVSLSGTTNIFLVANDTFTVSTMTGYGTLRCRRAR